MLPRRGENLKERFQPDEIPSSKPPPEPFGRQALRMVPFILVALFLIGIPSYYYMDRQGIRLFGGDTESIQKEDSRKLATVSQLMAEGKTTRALEIVQTLYTLHPDHADFVSEGAWINFKIDRYKQALKLSQKAIRLDPGRARDHAVLGACQLFFKDFKPALVHSLKALELDPDQALAYLTIGEIYLKEDDLERALPALKKAGRLEPGNPRVWLRLSSAFIKLEQWGRAEEAATNSLKLREDSPGVHFNLGMVYYQTGKGLQAVEHMQRAEDLYHEMGQQEWTSQARKSKELILKKFKLRPEDIAS